MPGPEVGSEDAFCGVVVLKVHTHVKSFRRPCDTHCPGRWNQGPWERLLRPPQFLCLPFSPRAGLRVGVPSPSQWFPFFLPPASPPQALPPWASSHASSWPRRRPGFPPRDLSPPAVPGSTRGSESVSETRAPALLRNGVDDPARSGLGHARELAGSMARRRVAGRQAEERERC